MEKNEKLNYLKYKNLEQKKNIYKIVLLYKVYIGYFLLLNSVRKKIECSVKKIETRKVLGAYDSYDTRVKDNLKRLNIIKQRGLSEWQKGINLFTSKWLSWREDERGKIFDGIKSYDERYNKLCADRQEWIEETLRLSATKKSGDLKKQMMEEIDESLKNMFYSPKGVSYDKEEILKLKNDLLNQMGDINTGVVNSRDYLSDYFVSDKITIDNFDTTTMNNLECMINKVQRENEELSLKKMIDSIQTIIKEGKKNIEKQISVQNSVNKKQMEKNIFKNSTIPDSLHNSYSRTKKNAEKNGVYLTYDLYGNTWDRKYIIDSSLTSTKTEKQSIKDYQNYIANIDTSEVEKSDEELKSMDSFTLQFQMITMQGFISSEMKKYFDKNDGLFVKHVGNNDLSEWTRVLGLYKVQQKDFWTGIGKDDVPFWQKKMYNNTGNGVLDWFSKNLTLKNIASIAMSATGVGILGSLALTAADSLSSKAYYGDDMSWGQVGMNFTTGAISSTVSMFGSGFANGLTKDFGNNLLGNIGKNVTKGLINTTFNYGTEYINKGFYQSDSSSLGFSWDKNKANKYQFKFDHFATDSLTSAGQSFVNSKIGNSSWLFAIYSG